MTDTRTTPLPPPPPPPSTDLPPAASTGAHGTGTTYQQPSSGSTPPPSWSEGGPSARPARRGPSVLLTALVAGAVAATTSLGVVLGADLVEGDPAPADTPETPGEVEPTATSETETATGGMAVEEIAASAAPSVAAVEVSVASAGPLGAPGGTGRGSAVIIDPDGLLATNAHVVSEASTVEVTLADGARHEAEVLGIDEATDLAVIEIDATDLPAVELATELPSIGSTAVAIGSPFGLDGSVSSGIVSALDRTLGGQGVQLSGLIQTDAAINPGNSGGALLDDRGRLIGINTAILSPSGANDGVGFAVPSTTVADITEQLAATGTVQRATLGIQGQDVDPQVAEAYALGTDTGAVVVAVAPDSAAEAAGLERGDIVTAVNGESVDTMSELAREIQSHEPGDTIELEVHRNGSSVDIEVELD